jgi:hypothetical protein
MLGMWYLVCRHIINIHKFCMKISSTLKTKNFEVTANIYQVMGKSTSWNYAQKQITILYDY